MKITIVLKSGAKIRTRAKNANVEWNRQTGEVETWQLEGVPHWNNRPVYINPREIVAVVRGGSILDDLRKYLRWPFGKKDVWITDVGPKKIQVIKAIREITRIGLKSAKELTDIAESFEARVAVKLTQEEAAAAKRLLEGAGATVSIRRYKGS